MVAVVRSLEVPMFDCKCGVGGTSGGGPCELPNMCCDTALNEAEGP